MISLGCIQVAYPSSLSLAGEFVVRIYQPTLILLPAAVLPYGMSIPAVDWPSESHQLLFIGFSVVTAIALAYDYVTTEGLSDVFFAIIGGSLLLTVLATVPVLLINRRYGLN